jgi:hypothetical protein
MRKFSTLVFVLAAVSLLGAGELLGQVATRLVIRTVAGDSSINITAGTAQNLRITAKDLSGNTDTLYAGARTLTFSGADSSLSPATAPTITDSLGAQKPFGTITTLKFVKGVATVTGGVNNGVMRLYRAQSAIVSVTAGLLSSPGTDRLTVTVSAGLLGKFAWVLAAPQVSGVAFTGADTLKAQDDWGNTVTSFNASTTPVTVTTSLGGTVSGLGSPPGYVLNQASDFASGIALLAGKMIYTGTSGTGTFTATGGTKSGTSASIAVNAGAATRLVLRTVAGDSLITVAAGVAQGLRITALDASGNVATGYTNDKTLTFSGAAVSPAPESDNPTVANKTGSQLNFSAGTTINFVNGVATASGANNGVMRLYKTEVATISVTDGSISASLSSRLTATVTPAGLGRFTVGLTSPQINGASFTGVNRVTAVDSFGNDKTNFNAVTNNVTLNPAGLSGTVSGLGSAGNNVLNQSGDFVSGVSDVTGKIKYTGLIGTGTFTATSAGKTGSSGNVQINVGSAARLVITGNANQVAGGAQDLTITARDSSGNMATGYTGDKTLRFSGSGPSPNPATPPTVTDKDGAVVGFGSSLLIRFSGGIADVSGSAKNGVMRLYRAGKDTVSVTDETISAGGGDRLIVTVSEDALQKFVFTLSSPQQSGVAFTGTNTLVAQDSYGNVVTSFSAAGDNVAVTANAPLAGVVSGLGSGSNNILNQFSDFSSGVANLTGKIIFTGPVGAGLFTAVSGTSKAGTTPTSVSIVAGGATRLVIAGATSMLAGGAQNLTITAKDAVGNTVTTYTGAKTLTYSGADSSLSGSAATVTSSSGAAIAFGVATPTLFTNGVATVSGGNNGVMRLYCAQTATIAVSNGAGLSSSGIDRLTVAVSASALGKFAWALASPQTSGTAFIGINTLTAQDDYGNTVGTFDASLTNVTITTSLSGAITGLGTPGLNVLNRGVDFVGGVANLTTLAMKYTGSTGPGTFTATGGGKTGLSAAVQMVAGSATRLVVRTSIGDSVTTFIVGGSHNLTISAKDEAGNTVTTYAGPKSLLFAGADSSLIPPVAPTVSNSTGTPTSFGAPTTITFVNGVATVSGSNNGVMRLYRAQNTFISVSEGSRVSTGTDRLSVTVNPSVLDKFTWSLTSPQANGNAFAGINTLTAQDFWGNSLTTYDASASNVIVTTSLVGTITGLGTGNNNLLNRQIDFVAGVANLTSLGMKFAGTIGTGTFTATSAGKAGTSLPVQMVAGGAGKFVIAGSSPQTAGTSQNLTITAKDLSGNVVLSYTGNRTLVFSGASASINPVVQPTVADNSGMAIAFGLPTVVTFANGIAVVTGGANGAMKLYKAETATISVRDDTVGSSGTDRLAVVVLPSALGQFAWNLTSPQTNDAFFSGANTLTAQDDWGNTVPAFDASTDNVTVTTSLSAVSSAVSGLGLLDNNVLNQASDFTLGVANLTAVGMKYTGTAGTGTFTAISAVGSKSGTSASITMNNPSPSIAGVSPPEASRLQTVTITITGTNFLSKVTGVEIDPTITVDSIMVESATRLTARVRPGETAALGPKNVTVRNPAPGGTGATLTNAFTVKNVPTIISLSPSSGFGGQPVAVVINGTNFVNGASTVGIQGSNLTLDSSTVVSSSTMIAHIRISPGAPDGIRSFTVTNSGTYGGTSNAQGFTVGNNPVPKITSITPVSAARLQSSVELIVRGTGFYNGITSLKLGPGITIASTVVDSTTKLRVVVAIQDTAPIGQRNILVSNTSPGGGSDSLVNGFAVTNPSLTLTGLSPQNGSRLQTVNVTLTGTRFIKNVTTVNMGGGITAANTVVENAGQLLVDLRIDSSAALGPRNVIIGNPAPGGGADTLASAFTVNNPVPTVASIVPESTLVSGSVLNLTVNGTNFVPGSVIHLGSLALTATIVSRAQLTTSIPVSELDTARSFVIDVTNPAPGGGISNNKSFTVQNPLPTLASVAPASGSRLQTLDVVFTGTNYSAGVTTVNFGGADITINSISVTSTTALKANITISATAVFGARDVFVNNPTPGGGNSEKRTFTVASNPIPTITAVAPVQGSRLGRLDVVVDGTNFIAGVTSIDFGTGITLNPPVVINSATRLTANLTIGVAAPTGARGITVTNAAPGGGSATRPSAFSVVNPEPKLHSFIPTNGQQLQTFNVVFDGTGFINGVSTVSMGNGITINGQNVLSDTLITANVTITISATTGPRDIWVTNLSPGGGTALLTNGFVVGNNPAPTLASLSPTTARRLETLNLVFRGTNFVSGVTSVDLGPDIGKNSVTVDSAGKLTAGVTVSGKAATGQRTVFITNDAPGGGRDSLLNALNIVNPVPVLTSITPALANRSQTLNVILRGTNFISGATTPNFGGDVTLNSTTVDSATRITVNISVGAQAVMGPRNMLVANSTPGGGNSPPLSFTIILASPLPPVLGVPANGQPNLPTTPVLRWDSTAGAVAYHLQVSGSPLFATTVADDTTLTTASRRVGPLSNNSTYYWHVRARNAGGYSQFSPTWSFSVAYPATIPVSHTRSFPSYNAPTDYKANEYRLIGLPGTSITPLSAFVPGTQGTDWQVYWDNGAAASYFQVYGNAPVFTFSAGKAYWLIRKNAWAVNATVDTAPLDSSGSVVIPLHSGWNTITNPFWLSIKWSDVQSVNGVAARSPLWAFNGEAGFEQSANLETYIGYYFFNIDGVASLRIPYGATSGVLKQADSTGSETWQVGITLMAGEYSDRSTWFGVDADALDGLDIHDYRKPRAMGDMPGTWFRRPDMDQTYEVFATDIRPPVKTLARWNVDVRTIGRDPVTLAAEGVDRIPQEMDVYLIDPARARYTDLRHSAEYTFTPVTPVAKFIVLVGTGEAVAGELSQVLPREFSLGANFPNPFNPATTLPVSVPVAADVTLKVYSILGEEIRTVHSGVLEAGRHWMVWDGRNDAGAPVATGVYLARLATPAGAGFVTKMLLLK